MLLLNELSILFTSGDLCLFHVDLHGSEPCNAKWERIASEVMILAKVSKNTIHKSMLIEEGRVVITVGAVVLVLLAAIIALLIIGEIKV